MKQDKKPLESKKFIAFGVGSTMITLFTFVGLFIMASNVAVASAVVNLLTVSLAGLSGLISIYVSGQSAVDWKIRSDHKTDHKTDIKKETIEEHKDFEMQYDDLDDMDWNEHEKHL